MPMQTQRLSSSVSTTPKAKGVCRPGLPITQAAVQFAFSVSPDRITR
jgi:hypothetical protein